MLFPVCNGRNIFLGVNFIYIKYKKLLYKCKSMLKPSSFIDIVETLCAPNCLVFNECLELKRSYSGQEMVSFIFSMKDNEDTNKSF